MSSEKPDLDIIFGLNMAPSWVNPSRDSGENSTRFTPTGRKLPP